MIVRDYDISRNLSSYYFLLLDFENVYFPIFQTF